MSYSTEISKILAETFGRFATLNSHQLAGHAVNLDFWLAETRHCFEVIEGYRRRFEAMTAAQTRYVAEKHTMEYRHTCQGFCPICDKGTPAEPPRRVPKEDLNNTLRELREAAYRFLVRCHKTGLIDETQFRQAADSIGTSVDVNDLGR